MKKSEEGGIYSYGFQDADEESKFGGFGKEFFLWLVFLDW
jgi:hypothetical protein